MILEKKMTLDDLKKKRKILKKDSDATLQNMQTLANESLRVANVAHNSRKILDSLDEEFERQTGLESSDLSFLFAGVALHCARIYVINNMKSPAKLTQGDKGISPLQVPQIINDAYSGSLSSDDNSYYVPLNQIITGKEFPYDVEDNHKKSKTTVFGKDPVLGLLFGTANILTNTTTSISNALIRTDHVKYDLESKKLKKSKKASTGVMLKKTQERVSGDPVSVIAAVIKQVGHTAVDLKNKCGVNIPESNLILTDDYAEKLAQYIGIEETIKVGISIEMITLINTIISTFHMMRFDSNKFFSEDIYSVKTRKILLYSNIIATASNTIWVGANIATGNEKAIKDLDIAGLIAIVHRLRTDAEFVNKIKEEFIFGNFNRLIQGDDLNLIKTSTETISEQ